MSGSRDADSTEVATGRSFLCNHRPEDALPIFEVAYEAAREELASESPDATAGALSHFVHCAYWRAAAFTQLRMWSEAEQQTYELLKFTYDEHSKLTPAEHALIYYGRGRYYLEASGYYDAIACFDSALGQDDSLERALRDRVRAYRGTDHQAALFYAMQAIRVAPNSFGVRAELVRALLDAGLWVQAEGEARALVADYPDRQPATLLLLARSLAAQDRIVEARECCELVLGLDDQYQQDQYQEALELMSVLRRPAALPVDDGPIADGPIADELIFDGLITDEPIANRPIADGLAPDADAEPSAHEQSAPEETDSTDRVNIWLQEASAYKNAQYYAAAGQLYASVLATDPDNIAAVHGQLDCLRLTHQFREASAKAKHAIERHPEDWALHVEVGRLLHSQGECEEALEWYDKADALQPGDIEICVAKSISLCAAGRNRTASDSVNELLEENPDSFLLLEELAWIAYFQRRYADADYAFGELYDKADRDFRARGTQERKLELAKTSYGRGYVAMRRGDYDRAKHQFGQARHYAPAVAAYQLALAWALAQSGTPKDLEKARKTCLELIKKTGNPLAHNCLGVVYFKLDALNDAEYHLEWAVRHGWAASSRADLGAYYALAGRFSLAVDQFREVITLDRENTDARYELGRLLLALRDKKKIPEAESTFRQAKAADPNSVLAVLGLARCFRLRTGAIEAERELSTMLNRFQDDANQHVPPECWRLRVELATILIGRGDAEQKPRLYREALDTARDAIGGVHSRVA